MEKIMQFLAKIPYGDIVKKKFLHLDSEISVSDNMFQLNEPDSVRRIIAVLRGKTGDEFVIVSDSFACLAVISEITRKNICFKLAGIVTEYPELQDITFALSPVKKAGLYENMIAYLVQMGIGKICFLKTCRTQFDITESKLSRLRVVVRNHCEICKSVQRPAVETISFENLSQWSEKYVFHPCLVKNFETVNLKKIMYNIPECSIFISGPEGGFSDLDIEKFSAIENVYFVTTGSEILKAETIPVYVSSILHFLKNA